MVLRMVLNTKLKVPQGMCFGVWRNWMDAHHIAGSEPISLWREKIGPSSELVW